MQVISQILSGWRLNTDKFHSPTTAPESAGTGGPGLQNRRRWPEMKVKSRSQLQQAATNIFQDLEKNYQSCEIVYIISELLKIMSLIMLQREEA